MSDPRQLADSVLARPEMTYTERQLAVAVLELADRIEAHTPTQWAYDQACKALNHYRAIADEATAALVRSSLDAGEAERLRRRFDTPLASAPEETR